MYKKITGLEAPTEEYISCIDTTEYDIVKKRFFFTDDKVEFWDDIDQLKKVIQFLEENYNLEITSGGTVSNTLYYFSSSNYGDNKIFEVLISGCYHANNYTNSSNPLDSLRSLGIKFNLSADLEANRLGLCIINGVSKEVIKIIVSPNNYIITEQAISDKPEYIVLTLQRLEVISSTFFQKLLSGNHRLIIVIADYTINNAIVEKRLTELTSHNKIQFIFGQYRDYIDLAIISANCPKPQYKNIELIGTNNIKDVYVWDPATQAHTFHKVGVIENIITGSTLGAGDCYAGTYLWSRLNNLSIAASHSFACEKSRKSLAYVSSRIPVSINLNTLYGHIMDGRNGTNPNEFEFYDIVRRNCGLSIISCGQTGIDQCGLKAANDLGLPLYSLMPNGKRTERTENITPGVDNLYDSFVLEYSSSSYRFCTYSTVFMSDGTLIFDYLNSEGSSATRDACALLGRPYLDLANVNTPSINSIVFDWIQANGVRVINIAGNRERFLNNEQLHDAYSKLFSIFKYCSYRLKQYENENIIPQLRNYQIPFKTKLNVCFSNSMEARLLLKSFLKYALKKEIEIDKNILSLFISDLNAEFFFVRSRDVPYIVKNDLCAIGFCGNDIVEESGYSFQYLLNTGIQPCMMMMLKAKRGGNGVKVVSQYPNLTRNYFKDKKDNYTVHEIQGSAEAWLKGGWCDYVVDTWRTGRTAYVNEIIPHKEILSTYLNLIADSAAVNCKEFMSLFNEWLLSDYEYKT